MKSTSLYCGALLAAGLIISAGESALAVPVEFGTPDNLELGAAPLPAKSTWGMSWDYRSSGHASEKLEISWETMELKASRIVPSPSGHAINTKGAGSGDRVSFSSTDPTFAARPHKPIVWIKGSWRIQVPVDVGPDAEGDSNVLLLNIDITSPRGWTFAADPTATLTLDGTGIDIVNNLVAPVGDTSDPSLPSATYLLSAEAVPEPSTAALIGIAGLIGIRRRA
jgi:PEP-CTERM motif